VNFERGGGGFVLGDRCLVVSILKILGVLF
jgi:hypothetical protein